MSVYHHSEMLVGQKPSKPQRLVFTEPPPPQTELSPDKSGHSRGYKFMSGRCKDPPAHKGSRSLGMGVFLRAPTRSLPGRRQTSGTLLYFSPQGVCLRLSAPLPPVGEADFGTNDLPPAAGWPASRLAMVAVELRWVCSSGRKWAMFSYGNIKVPESHVCRAFVTGQKSVTVYSLT